MVTFSRSAQLHLVGAGGEPVDLWRTLVSHGIASLPPMFLDEEARTLETTLPVAGGRPRTVRIAEAGPSRAAVATMGRPPGRAARAGIIATVRHMLRLDEDLSEFYAVAAGDPALAWVTAGAGRMLRSPTVFEDVVKTVCTTNCSWALTQRMVAGLVGHLGETAPGAPPDGHSMRAFPTAAAMAAADDALYRDVVRAGYRGPYLRSLALSVAEGTVDLDRLPPGGGLTEDEVEAALLALPGVGPYAAAHIMMLLGWYSRLILDSWTRPTYARLVGRRSATDAAIARRFRRFGRYAGLAFWLFLTRDWVEEATEQQAEAFSEPSA
jgi:3-methyladenine DNA glycosylase/8-oxoguanine DNA glycosylase